MGAYLPVSALPGLKKYKYNSEDKSLVSKYVLKPFYARAVEYLPLWLAPNMVTLLGLFFSLDSFLRAVYYGLGSGAETPRWVYFAHAFDIFMYQTLDALDGLQARRTGASSPLGELFDHCVDAINTTLQAYVAGTVYQYSPHMALFGQFLCTVNFFMSTWEEYHTKKLFLSVFSGPVEGILICMLTEIATGLFGSHIWMYKLIGPFTTQHALSVAASIGLVVNTLGAMDNVRKAVGHKKFLKSLYGLSPFITLWSGFIAWSVVAQDSFKEKSFIPFTLTIGFTFALLVGRLILAHVTTSPYPMWTPLLVLPFIGIASHFLGNPFVDENQFLWASCGLAFGVYASFVAEIVVEITTYLDIGCLYIKEKKN